jgi:hypothetical protein
MSFVYCLILSVILALQQGCDICLKGLDDSDHVVLTESKYKFNDRIPVRVDDPEELRANLRYIGNKLRIMMEADKRKKMQEALDSPTTTCEDRSDCDSPAKTSSIRVPNKQSQLSGDFASDQKLAGRYTTKRTSFIKMVPRYAEQFAEVKPVTNSAERHIGNDENSQTWTENEGPDNESEMQELFFGDVEIH